MSGVSKMFSFRRLISEEAPEYWFFLVFVALLALVMIASSHSVDSKIHRISKKNKEVKEYRTRFVDGRSRLMKLQMESKVLNRIGKNGVKPSVDPPYKIIVE